MNYMPRKQWKEIRRPVYEYERLLTGEKLRKYIGGFLTLCVFLAFGYALLMVT